MKPDISIILPVYNVEKFIHQCLDSILSQKNVDFEIIAVDDGSPDECPAILDRYAEQDNRIRVIHQKNAGVSEARNRGIAEAKGKWSYFVDSDDWIEPDQLTKAVTTANQIDADVLFVDCKEQYESGKNRRIKLFSHEFVTAERKTILQIQVSVLCHKMNPYYIPGADSAYPAPWSKLIRTSLIKKNGILYDSYVGGVYDDGLFTLDVLEVANKIAYSEICLYDYRILNNSLVHSYKKGTIEKFEKNCLRVDDFIERNGKTREFVDAEYARRIAYLSSMLASAFTKEGMITKKEIVSIIGRSPWKEAITNVNGKLLEKKHRYTLACLKLKSLVGLKLYSVLKQIKTRMIQ